MLSTLDFISSSFLKNYYLAQECNTFILCIPSQVNQSFNYTLLHCKKPDLTELTSSLNNHIQMRFIISVLNFTIYCLHSIKITDTIKQSLLSADIISHSHSLSFSQWYSYIFSNTPISMKNFIIFSTIISQYSYISDRSLHSSNKNLLISKIISLSFGGRGFAYSFC